MTRPPATSPTGPAIRHVVSALLETRFGLMAGERRRAIVARHLREALEEAGPGFVKAGQLLSVRPDLVPSAWIAELERLQDAGPTVPFEEIRSSLRRELGGERDWPFTDLDETPLAAASIAQVHRATLARDYRPIAGEPMPAGTLVAVKILRPGIEARLTADLAWARRWARRGARLPGAAAHSAIDALDEIEASAARELDLRHEGRVADRFRRDFSDDPRIQVPRVVWSGTTQRALTSEWVEGWRLSELGPAERAGIDARGLAEHGARAFLRQVLELGRFHADLHPANLLVTPTGRICYLDFGIVGHADRAQRSALAQLLAATAYGDAERALRASRGLGLEIPTHAEATVRDEAARLIDMHLRQSVPADVRGFATGFLSLLRRHRIAIPAGYGLLVKALLTVEGVARGLYPDLDVVEVARPIVTRLVARERIGGRDLMDRLPDALRAGLREVAS